MSLEPITLSDESINYLAPSWDDLNHLAFIISQKIHADNLRFDRLVTLAKGGWPMTYTLIDFLDIKEVASIGVRFYNGINQHMEKPELYQALPVSVAGERILLFDDVADSGESLYFAKDYLHSLGVEGITTATLFFKPKSRITPNYYGTETNSWILFPYDLHESIHILGGKWEKQGIEQHEIIQRFVKLGYSEEMVEYFLSVCHPSKTE